jgi:hypothetical protein
MPALSVDVAYRDGRAETFQIWPSVIVAFETEVGMDYYVAIRENETNSYRLAWMAAKDAGTTSAPFDEWIKTIADIGAAASTPTSPASEATPDSSQGSQSEPA